MDIETKVVETQAMLYRTEEPTLRLRYGVSTAYDGGGKTVLQQAFISTLFQDGVALSAKIVWRDIPVAGQASNRLEP